MHRDAVIDHLRDQLGDGWTLGTSGSDSVLGFGGRGVVVVDDSAGATRVSVRGAAERRMEEITVSVASDADLGRLAPVLEAARWWSARLTPTSLVPGQRYFVRRPFVDRYEAKVPAGETLTFNRTDLQRYDRTYTILFLERRIYLREDSDAVADFDLYFEPA